MRRGDLRALLLAGALLALLLEVTSHLGAPPSPGNRAADGVAAARASAGVASWVLRGARAPEGSRPLVERALVLAREDGVLEIALGGPTAVRGLLVQAEGDDRYRLEASADGTGWQRIGAVRAVPQPGLRTRSLELGELPPLRALRLRAMAPGLSVLSAVRVYETLPEGWPAPAPGPDRGAWPLVDGMGPVLAWRLSIALLGLAGALAFWRLRGRERQARLLLATAGVLALLSGWDFFQNARPLGYLWSLQNHWDVYHYYLGAKYAPELGYTELYRCTLAADLEAGLGPLRESGHLYRDLATNELVPVAAADAGRCAEGFGPERWRAFAADVAWFRGQLPPGRWLELARDHGYNPSPAWAVVGRPVAEWIPLRGPGFALLMALDTLLLLVLWGAAARSFGLPGAAAGLVFFGTSFAAGHWWTHGAFLRHGWLFLTVIGLCCLRRDRPATAGFLLAWATLLRIFPAFFVIGVALRAGLDLASRRRLRLAPERWRFVAGGLAAVVAIGGLSLLASGRTDAWQAFARNTAKHYDTTALNTMGALAVTARLEADLGLARGTAEPGKEPAPGRAARLLRIALAVAVLPLLLLAIRRQPDWAAALLASAWIPFVTDLGSYYFVVVASCAFLTSRRRVAAVGVTALAVALAAIGVWDGGVQRRETFVVSSACILAFHLWLLGTFAVSRRSAADAAG